VKAPAYLSGQMSYLNFRKTDPAAGNLLADSNTFNAGWAAQGATVNSGRPTRITARRDGKSPKTHPRLITRLPRQSVICLWGGLYDSRLDGAVDRANLGPNNEYPDASGAVSTFIN